MDMEDFVVSPIAPWNGDSESRRVDGRSHGVRPCVSHFVDARAFAKADRRFAESEWVFYSRGILRQGTL